MADRTSTIERADETPDQPSALGLPHRWARLIANNHRAVIVVWLFLIVACGLAYPQLNTRLEAPDFNADHAEATEVDQIIAQKFPTIGAEQNAIVFSSTTLTADSPEYRSAIDRAVTAARTVSGVTGVVGPFDPGSVGRVSKDGHAAVAIVGLDGDTAQRAVVARDLQTAVGAEGAGVEINVAGFSPIQNAIVEVEMSDLERAEAIGIPVAFLILIVALGALAAAAIPVVGALGGILLSLGILFLLTNVMTLPSLVVSMATMIGTGIGIDYAMFIVSRFREELARRGIRERSDKDGIADALGVALATAGKTIVASGLIVLISLCSLVVVEAPIFRAIAIGVTTAVIATLFVGLTLLPALLALLGPAVNRGSLPSRFHPAETRTGTAVTDGAWARWARIVMARPVMFGGVAVVILVLAALPLTGIKYGLDMGISALSDTPAGKGLIVLSDEFGPGLLAPVEIVVTGKDGQPLTADDTQRANRMIGELSRNDQIAAVFPQTNNGAMLITTVPKSSFDSTTTADLVRELRSEAQNLTTPDGPEIRIGGSTAEFIDVSHEITTKFPLVIALVLGWSFLFLIYVFRSLLLALKAILMNLLATGAALGITVAVFQWGYGESLLNFESTGFVQVFLPTMVFAVLFGLSMDYEVFLIRRMKESWDGDRNSESGPDNEKAVVDGIQHTARPITAAAAIMVVVFGSFVTADVLELKQIGFALALAIAIDSVIIRLILVPALMRLFGQWNWWLPQIRRRAPS